MKKLLLSILLIGSASMNAQTTLIEDGFETYDDFLITGFGTWSTLDIDQLPTYTGGGGTWENAGAAHAYIIFNPTVAAVTNATSGAEVRNFDSHGGAKYAASWAAVPGANPANEDWLISPPVTLGSSGNELTVWVKSMSNSYGLEEYSIGVFVGSGEPASSADFILIAGPAEAPYPAWEEVVLPLDDFNGQTVRVGILNQGADHYMFMVDDFKITTTGLSVNQAFSSKFGTYPNPVNNVLNISNNENIVINGVTVTDINGRTVKTVTAESITNLQMNVSELNAGVYFLNINTEQGIAVKKFIKN